MFVSISARTLTHSVAQTLLGTWGDPRAEGWTPGHSLSTALLSIQSLMNEAPLYNEPGCVTASARLRARAHAHATYAQTAPPL
jgi:ubiquitin-protein ligase